MLYKPRTTAEIDAIIERTAEFIYKKELEEVAFLVFETIKPVALVGGKLGGASLAFLIPIIGYSVDDYMVAFQEPENIDKLLRIIETRRLERIESRKKEKEAAKVAQQA
jgi:hypothetical protein